MCNCVYANIYCLWCLLYLSVCVCRKWWKHHNKGSSFDVADLFDNNVLIGLDMPEKFIFMLAKTTLMVNLGSLQYYRLTWRSIWFSVRACLSTFTCTFVVAVCFECIKPPMLAINDTTSFMFNFLFFFSWSSAQIVRLYSLGKSNSLINTWGNVLKFLFIIKIGTF